MIDRQEIIRCVESAGALVAVTGIPASPGRFAEILFEFSSQAVRLVCTDDTDEIEISILESEKSADRVAIEPLGDLIGCQLEYTWLLTNHRGYDDGFQMQFLDAQREERIVQFEVAASTMNIRRVES